MPAIDPSQRVEATHAVQPEDRLLVGGPDALDFLHRISASETRDLGPGRVRHLVFTDDKGSLVDAPLACRTADGFVLVSGPGRGAELGAWLQKWIILEDLDLRPDPEPTWRLGEPDLGSGMVIEAPSPAGPALQRGGTPPPHEVDAQAWEAALFSAGRFHCGPATALGPNPLELGWRDLISFDKGCYIGQEVIARMDTYDKVRRRLAPARLLRALEPGARLAHGGRGCGLVLSHVVLGGADFAWVLVDRGLEDGAKLDAANEAAGTLIGMPAA